MTRTNDHDGDAQACLVGGVEHMGHVPMSHGVDFHPGLEPQCCQSGGHDGLNGRMLARMHGISREMQDAFAGAVTRPRLAATQSAGI